VWGETRLKQYLGGAGFKPSKGFKTSLGIRFVDRLVGRVAHESKAGVDVKLDSKIRKQVEKDVELIETGQVDAVHWHFWQGATRELLDFLEENNIGYTLHP
jgi:ribosomal protein L15